jgi:acyl-CoA synthetase (AMP-forming)/AMP-acid ligase II
MAWGEKPISAPVTAEMAGWPLHHFLRARAALSPDLPALDIPPGKDRPQRVVLSYAELDALSDRLARQLAPRIAGEAIVAL